MIKVPFLDLKRVNEPYEEAYKQSLNEMLGSGNYILGNNLEIFETAFARYCGSKNCVGVGNGLDALTLILKGYIRLGKLNIGDNVLVASNTFIATILSIVQAELIPVLVEPEENSHTIDPKEIHEALSCDVKAIVVTHLYGQLADLSRIRDICNKNNLLLIDDAAQAHGAEDEDGNKAGNLCDATSFSFYPTKNLGALGDGGAVTTNDSDLTTIIKKLRNYGKENSYEFNEKGFNSRLDELQAAFLSKKLPYLDQDNEVRRKIAKRYLEGIKNSKISLPLWDGSKAHVFHLFVITVKERIRFCNFLDEHNIGYHLHYPVPPHLQKVGLFTENKNYPITEKLSDQVVSLPLFPGLTDTEIDYVIEKLNLWTY